MSASSKKKLRKEQNAAAMTQKQQAAAKEAKKLKIYTITFWVILALCVSLVAGVALKTPVTGMITRMTTALVVGEHKVSAVELNYFYIDAINEYVNQYSSWISYIMDTSSPLSAQDYDKTAGITWADHFLDSAIESAKNTYALYDAAQAAGHTLSEEEKTAMQTLYDNMDVYAKNYGYNNANEYLEAVYGNGANTKTYKAYYEVVIMASSYYAAYAEKLQDSYTDVILREFEGDETYKYNSYSYASHLLEVDNFKFGGTEGEDGEIEYSEEEIKAAEEYVKKAAEELANADNNTIEKLNAAIAALEKRLAEEKAAAEKSDEDTSEDTTEDTTEDNTEDTAGDTTESQIEAQTNDTAEGTTDTEDTTDDTTGSEDETDDTTDDTTGSEDETGDTTDDTTGSEDEGDEGEVTYSTATEKEEVLYSSVSSLMQEWMRDSARKEGDITFIEYTSQDSDGNDVLKGYYVVLFQGVNDNKFALANVRHILVAFEGGTYNSTTGVTTYTDEEKQAAQEKAQEIYDEWLKGEKTEDSFAALAKEKTDDSNGDEGGLYEDIYPGQMVETFEEWCFAEGRQAGDHGIVQTDYGWHIMFYSGDSETNYRDYMVSNDKLTEDMEAWQTSLVDAISLTEKTTKYVNKDYIISSSY